MAANVTKIDPALANYWWSEHLLCLPDVDTEIVTHFGERLKELPTGNMPASLAVRLFLRQIMLHSMTEEELLSVMGLFQLHSEKQQQFQSTAVAQAIQPPDALLIEVLQQCLVSYCLHSFQQGQSLHDITAAVVEQQALQILQQAQLERLLESEQLKQSVATLQHVLGSIPQPKTIDAVQQLLYDTFPKHLMEADLQQFANSAWKALGASSLEVFQRATLSGQLPFHPFLNFLQENEELQHEFEQRAQQQQAEPTGADNPAIAATPGEPLIVGGQQQELVIPDSTDPVAANKLTQPSSTPGIPSPRSGSDPAPAAAGGKQQRRVGDLAAAAVRGQLNLLPSTAAARNTVNHQQQQCTAAAGEENTPPEEQAAVLQALVKTQALAAAAAAKQQQLGRGTIKPPRPLAAAAAAVSVLTWEEQVMGHAGAGIAWGGDRRKLKNDKIRAEKQQTAEERARKRAEREEREAQQKAARKLLKEQERARREEEKKAAEAATRAEAKAARAKQRQEEERRKEVERELARLQREEAKAAKQAEKEELKKERAAARKAAQAAGKKAILDSEEEMEIPEEGEEDEEEFVSIAEDSSSEDLSSESDGWSTESTSVQELDSDEAGGCSSRPAAAAAARKAGSKIRKPLPQAKIRRERVSGSDSDQQASGGHGRVAPGRGRKPSKQAAAAAEDSEDLFADLEVKSDADSDQPANVAAAAAAGGSKRKPDTASEDPLAAAATAGPSKMRKTAAAAAAHGVQGRPSRPDLEQGEVQPAAAAAEPAIKQQKSAKAAFSADGANPAKKGLCGRGGPKTGAGRTLQWDSSPSERADELKATSPSACQGPQTAAEMRAHLARHREKNGGVSVAAAMLELLAQKKRDNGPGGDMSDDEEEADEAARARGHRREASKRQAAAAEAAEGEEAVDGSGGDIYDYVMNGSDEEQQRRKRKKKQKKAAAAAAAAGGDAAAGGAAAARVPDIAGAAPAGAGAGPKAPSSSTPLRAAEAEGKPGGRRKVVRWSKQEEELLEQLVEKYGVGKWAAIKEEGAGTFLPHRTAVDLKDKWRNILKGRGLF